MAIPQRPRPAQPPRDMGAGRQAPQAAAAAPQAAPGGGGLSPDDLLARDFNVIAKPANLFRFRIDKDNVVVDFGYLPPIIQNEISQLTKDVVDVHTRIAIGFDLAKEMASKLVETIQEAESM